MVESRTIFLTKLTLDSTKLSCHRPIFNLSFICELVERVAASRFVRHAERNALFPVSDSTSTQYCRRSALYKLLCMYVCISHRTGKVIQRRQLCSVTTTCVIQPSRRFTLSECFLVASMSVMNTLLWILIAIKYLYCEQQACAEKTVTLPAVTEVAEEDVEKAKEAAKKEDEAVAAEAPPRAPQTAAEIMAAAAKTAEERSAPLCSSRMLLARSLVARQEKLYDRLADIRRHFGEIDAEVISLRNARYAHYTHYEERHRQQQAHLARARLISGR